MSPSPFEQRREAFRVGMSGRVRVGRAGDDSAKFELRDLSVSGARLIGDVRLDLDEMVTIALVLQDEEVTLTARVVRLDDHGCGLQFGSLPRAVENRISRFLTAEQRRRVQPRA